MNTNSKGTGDYGTRSEQDNGRSTLSDRPTAGERMALNSTPTTPDFSSRSYIRVYEEGLGTSYNEYSEYSERHRREAESERLVTIAKQCGQYNTHIEFTLKGKRHGKNSGESIVYIDQEKGRVYKYKNPYAKSPMKSNVRPEDVIYEHLVHNKYFPETAYYFEGISDDIGDVRILLSQEFINAYRLPSRKQIEAALAEKGLSAINHYTFANDEISVTDISGDNALLGDNGQVYFIDPIINFLKPVSEIISSNEVEAP